MSPKRVPYVPADQFPFTHDSEAAITALASLHGFSYKEIQQEACIAEWSLSGKMLEDKAKKKYFWKTLYCRIVDLSRERHQLHRKRAYVKKLEDGQKIVSDEPMYPGQTRSFTTVTNQNLSLDQFLEENGEVTAGAGLIDGRSFNTLYTEDLITATVSLLAMAFAPEKAKIYVDMFMAKVTSSDSWTKIHHDQFSNIGHDMFFQHKRTFEKFLLDLFHGESRSYKSPFIAALSSESVPGLVGSEFRHKRASFLP